MAPEICSGANRYKLDPQRNCRMCEERPEWDRGDGIDGMEMEMGEEQFRRPPDQLCDACIAARYEFFKTTDIYAVGLVLYDLFDMGEWKKKYRVLFGLLPVYED